MHWVDLYELLEKVQQSHHLPAFLVGIASGSTGSLLLLFVALKLLKRGRSRGLIPELRLQITQVTSKWELALAEAISLRGQLDDKIQDRRLVAENLLRLEGQFVHQHQVNEELAAKYEQRILELSELETKLKTERKNRRDVEEQLIKLTEQLDGIMSSDGKVWLKPTKQVPAFMPLHQRKAVIISLANLKGGVGKTTLTANLGAALAAEGLRVLLIDLDHQSSLTSRCVTDDERTDLKRSGRFNDRLFERGGDLDDLNACVTRLQTPTGSGQLYLAPVDEKFDELEVRLMTRWHSGSTPDEDVRFRLRQTLHSNRLRDHYDVVLIDCPPRLTTGSINALTASDYVLIPVLLEEMSAEGVPRILGWLKKFQATVCGDLNILGVVGNKAYNRLTLIKREKAVWDSLQQRSRSAWGDPVHHFDEIIRDHPSVDGMFAALDPRYQPRYEELVNQIRRVIPHAYLRPPAVSPVDVAALDGVGG